MSLSCQSQGNICNSSFIFTITEYTNVITQKYYTRSFKFVGLKETLDSHLTNIKNSRETLAGCTHDDN